MGQKAAQHLSRMQRLRAYTFTALVVIGFIVLGVHTFLQRR